MTSISFAGYLIFAFVSSITPGPNNYILFSYGKNFGFRDSGKLMLGIFSGFFVMLMVSGYGVGELITANQSIGLVLKVISSVWLFYLAILMGKPSSEITPDTKSRIGFNQAFLFQFVNPKAWIMAITGASAFLPELNNLHLSVFLFAISFGVIGIPCMLSWIKFGELISTLLKSEKANRIIGYILFVLMILSIVMVWV
jgi:threonine/homoserine/homoserine lactone efflux protein